MLHLPEPGQRMLDTEILLHRLRVITWMILRNFTMETQGWWALYTATWSLRQTVSEMHALGLTVSLHVSQKRGGRHGLVDSVDWFSSEIVVQFSRRSDPPVRAGGKLEQHRELWRSTMKGQSGQEFPHGLESPSLVDLGCKARSEYCGLCTHGKFPWGHEHQ